MWRRGRDSNPRRAVNPLPLSKRPPSATRPPLLSFKIISPMNIFDRYILVNFLKILATSILVSVVIILLYSLAEFMIAFKVRSLDLGVRYSVYLLPLGIYIMFPLLAGVSVIVLLRRIFSKRIDLTAQSFGLSPLRFSLPVIVAVSLFSVTFLVLNESFIPGLFKKVWYMEKVFKKKQEVGRIVEDLWFVKTTEGKRYYVYVDSLDVITGRFANLFLLVTSLRGDVLGVVESRVGVWSGTKLTVEAGRAYSFVEGTPSGDLKGFVLETGIDLSEVGLFAEKIEHLRTSSLLTLYMKGSRIGFDTDRYMAEILFRGGMSMLGLVVVVPLLRHLFRRRDVRTAFLVLVLNLIVGWVVVISPKVATGKVNLPPQYYLVLIAALGIYVLKGVYDLGKGFRV